MRFNRLDLNLLVALDVLLTECNISRAAQRLHMSQSATSGVLGRLRDYFNDELLVQVGRKMEPTLLARRLAEPVRDIIFRVQTTLAIKAGFDPMAATQSFRISSSDYVQTVLLSRLLQEREKQAPGIIFEFMPQSDDVIELLKRGEYDFLIIPERYVTDDHPHVVLFEETFTCVVWEGNDQVGDSLDFDQYMKLGHITPRFGRSRQPSFEDWFIKQYGMGRRVDVVTSSFNSLAQLLVGTTLIATMHTQLARQYANYLPLRLLTPPITIPPLVECLQWPRFLDGDPGHTWLRQLIQNTASQLSPPS